MAKFDIYFFGLICHVGPDNDRFTKTHAALVQATNHGASIVIDGAAPSPVTKGIAFNPASKVIGVSQDVNDCLPHLHDLISGGSIDLDGNVKGELSQANVVGYVDYPASTTSTEFQVSALYNSAVRYKLAAEPHDRDRRCAAKLILLQVEQPALSVSIDGGPNQAVQSWVLIYNSAHGATVKDFKSYLGITKATSICDPYPDNTVNCSGVTPITTGTTQTVLDLIKVLVAEGKLLDADDIECTNSHWP
jgi:hypothetical protein